MGSHWHPDTGKKGLVFYSAPPPFYWLFICSEYPAAQTSLLRARKPPVPVTSHWGQCEVGNQCQDSLADAALLPVIGVAGAQALHRQGDVGEPG